MGGSERRLRSGPHSLAAVPLSPPFPVLYATRNSFTGVQILSHRNSLRWAMLGSGAAFCVVYPIAVLWPSGWIWHEGPPSASHYFLMIVGIYFVLGVSLIRAAKDPLANRSLIEFTVASSLVHALIMTVQSFGHGNHMGHLLGDVPALLIVAMALWLFSRVAEPRP